jgi:hypothetical protein
MNFTSSPAHKFQVKAHDVRALASSWALFNNASFNEVLSAGFWRGESSFLSHYLRSMFVQADNLCSLGPIVSAQRVNFEFSSMVAITHPNNNFSSK